jgi:phospholipase C
MMQENRSFDHYFGKLNDFRANQGLPSDVDGLPAGASNPSFDGTRIIQAFRMVSACSEDLSPAWNESHRQFNRADPTSDVGAMDGFVYSAANFTRNRGETDVEGIRAMGYYDAGHLPYYYFLATRFATSDRFFSSVLTHTPPNRLYMFAATSAGFTSVPTGTLSIPTIWHRLEEKGISWKIYTDTKTTLTTFQPFANEHLANIVPYDQYFADLTSGNLPAVSFIERQTGLDEHPLANVQAGAKFASKFINALMQSSSWSSSVLFLTFDEGGGLFDHVPPPPAPPPGDTPPIDLTETDTPGDFNRYGFRVPFLAISPFTKSGFVSHTVADFTALLKFIETRHQLANLTARDAAQPDMTEFFDFANPPNLTPPTPPEQPTDAPCYRDHLP